MNNLELKNFIGQKLFDEKFIFKKNDLLPKISVVIPSFQQADFLEKTILSILNQNYPNLELIIIDGGSNDSSLEIIKKYEKYITYWVSEKDRGQSDALNKGFKKATGEIVAYQNSDDIYLPGIFEKVADYFQKNPKIDLVYGNRLDINKNDEIISESRFTRFSKTVFKYDGLPLGSQSAFWRRSLFDSIGYFDVGLRFSMDHDFFMKAAVKKARFGFIRVFLGAMRRHQGSKTENFLGKPPHQAELEIINKRYGRKNWLKFLLKIYSLVFRIICYILQGDASYVFQGFSRRLKNKSILSGK